MLDTRGAGRGIMLRMTTIKCEKCKARWVPRVESPVRCPRCGKALRAVTEKEGRR